MRKLSKRKQAEKLKSREMKEEWIKNDECWRMIISSCWEVLWLTDWQTDRWTNERTNKQTFVNVEATENVGTLTAVRGDGLVKHWTSFYWAMK